MTELDKYEYNLKLEEIDKLVDQKDYEEAARMADTIDWRKVRNVRTLCLISEIYEASGRLEDSKALLLRAYRRSPVGRAILYRLVEITTALHQYDEAMEYYTEYVQVAPHDNNRYILKYQIYRGRGASVEELIEILEEYLGQEYTERWAYELAKLYQKAGQMQKCLATCDDLVLWFHSGRYVLKALELKKKYAPLTPKQQEIYEQQFLDAEPEEELPEEPEDVITKVRRTDGEVIAESIMAETEKEIAGEVTAHKAEIENEMVSDVDGKRNAEVSSGDKDGAAADPAGAAYDDKTLQMELARSMREIVAGVVKRTEEEEESTPVVTKKLQAIPPIEVTEKSARTAGRLTIDDVLLSMGEKGKAAAQMMRDGTLTAGQVPKADTAAASADAISGTEADDAQEEIAEKIPEKTAVPADEAQDDRSRIRRSVAEEAREELTEDQKEALRYTSNPEKLLRNRNALPTYREDYMPKEEISVPAEEYMPEEEVPAPVENNMPEEKTPSPVENNMPEEEPLAPADNNMPEEEEPVSQEELQKTRRIDYTREELQNEMMSGKTIRVPAEKIASLHQKYGLKELWQEQGGLREVQDEDDNAYPQEEPEDQVPDPDAGKDYAEEEPVEHGMDDGYEELQSDAESADGQEGPFLPNYMRGLFGGFTEVDGLEPQIANAVIQAVSNQGDRTSRSGNILIFGPHGSGKTTLATNIAKAVAQDKGNGSLKLARIYAADLNRKDIAATIARIAGGTLIIEEAGDLEPGVIDQLTTAMEFRTDGLLLILEDEEQYIHDLLMSHPRFTMKFTAQIYLPVYTAEELLMFAQHSANAQGYVIGQDGMEELYQRISVVVQEGKAVSVTDVTELVARAIHKSNKLLRKMSMGRKRYDDNDYIILFAKDFR